MLPDFKRTSHQLDIVSWQLQTARIVRMMWKHASNAQRRDGDFLQSLLHFVWLNRGDDEQESTRRWRNRRVADWAGVEQADDQAIVDGLRRMIPSLGPTKSREIIETPTGITWYYGALRPRTLLLVKKHRAVIAQACESVSRRVTNVNAKVERVALLVDQLPDFAAPAGGRVSLYNGLSPLFAALDPQRRFPIMNRRTAALLRYVNEDQNAQGAVRLQGLIGKHDIRHAFDLDVYAYTQFGDFPRPAAPRTSTQNGVPGRDIGLKSELASYASIARSRRRIRKLHNRLMNKFKSAVDWRFTLKEGEFDAVLLNWTPKRKLLVEAKTSSAGGAGRTQLRQAIGQLWDYRWRWFKAEANPVGLAVLLPTKPAKDIMGLLKAADIEVLWFEGKALCGTIQL